MYSTKSPCVGLIVWLLTATRNVPLTAAACLPLETEAKQSIDRYKHQESVAMSDADHVPDVLANFRDGHAPQHGALSMSNPVSWTVTLSKLAMSRAHDSALPAHLGLAARSPRKLHMHTFHVEKEKEKTTPFGVNLMRSPVSYQAAQGSRGVKVVVARPIVPPIASRLQCIYIYIYRCICIYHCSLGISFP